MIVYVKNPTKSTKQLLELIHQLNKVVGCKVNIKISIVFLYTSSKNWWKKTWKTIPLMSSKNIKDSGINLTKDGQDLYWRLQNITERNEGRPK